MRKPVRIVFSADEYGNVLGPDVVREGGRMLKAGDRVPQRFGYVRPFPYVDACLPPESAAAKLVSFLQHVDALSGGDKAMAGLTDLLERYRAGVREAYKKNSNKK